MKTNDSLKYFVNDTHKADNRETVVMFKAMIKTLVVF